NRGCYVTHLTGPGNRAPHRVPMQRSVPRMQEATAAPALQPLLHNAIATLRAPAQAWSRPDGSMGAGAIDGVYVSDVRVLRGLALRVDDRPVEHVATLQDAADHTRFVSVLRVLDGAGADPDVRGTL